MCCAHRARTSSRWRSLSTGRRAVLDRDLADVYPYRVFNPSVIIGKGVLSRYPIREDSGLFTIATSMTHLRLVLDVDGRPLTVIVAHPPRPAFMQGRYVISPGTPTDIATLAQMAVQGAPAILLGDFNATDQNSTHATLEAAGLTDAFRAVGWGFGATFPANARPVPPLVRIDYVWTTGEISAMRAWVGPDAGSDHLPLLADLVWR